MAARLRRSGVVSVSPPGLSPDFLVRPIAQHALPMIDVGGSSRSASRQSGPPVPPPLSALSRPLPWSLRRRPCKKRARRKSRSRRPYQKISPPLSTPSRRSKSKTGQRLQRRGNAQNLPSIEVIEKFPGDRFQDIQGRTTGPFQPMHNLATPTEFAVGLARRQFVHAAISDGDARRNRRVDVISGRTRSIRAMRSAVSSPSPPGRRKNSNSTPKLKGCSRHTISSTPTRRIGATRAASRSAIATTAFRGWRPMIVSSPTRSRFSLHSPAGAGRLGRRLSAGSSTAIDKECSARRARRRTNSSNGAEYRQVEARL